MTRSFAWDRFAFGFGPRGFFWAGPRGRRRRWFESGDMKYDIVGRGRDAVDRTRGGGMADVNRSLGRLLKTVYRTGWRARDEATRQRLVAILDHVVGEVEALATAKSSPAA